MRTLFVLSLCLGVSLTAEAQDPPEPPTSSEAEAEALEKFEEELEQIQTELDELKEELAVETEGKDKPSAKAKALQRKVNALEKKLQGAVEKALKDAKSPQQRADIVVSYLGGFVTEAWFVAPMPGSSAFVVTPGLSALPPNTVKAGAALGLGRLNPGGQTTILGTIGGFGVAAVPGEWTGIGIQSPLKAPPTAYYVPWDGTSLGSPSVLKGPFYDGGHALSPEGAGLIVFGPFVPSAPVKAPSSVKTKKARTEQPGKMDPKPETEGTRALDNDEKSEKKSVNP